MYTPCIILFLAAVALCEASSYQPTWEHFATEVANKAAPFHDLADFGIGGGQLPKVYNLRGGNMTYLPEESFALYEDVRAGRKNQTGGHAGGLSRRKLLECDNMQIILQGSCADFAWSPQGGCVNSANCVNQGGCTWTSVSVFNIQSAYITFWASDVCNGKKGSFNPNCNYVASQSCEFIETQWQSFRAYTGCHQQHESNC